MNYIGLAQEIQERYRRYLRTTFYFRDPELRESFRRTLDEGQIAKGPYIEATPPYRRGPTPAQLFPEIIGGPIDEKIMQAIEGQRRLYRHQEAAIRRVSKGHNIVVATGTGSGKTESFLYPILLHLYQEYLRGTLSSQSGARALILYPMNALAYDQRERLGGLAGRLKENGADFSFTFGQYTGATPENAKDRYRPVSRIVEQRLPGELVFREEMRNSPPHILLTNYSMLEYQLLRPLDSPLFDGAFGQTWTFLVLDEAHQYRGTRGNEMGLLLRRLKQRIRASGNTCQFRCIATSASLAGGDQDRAPIADFASRLFDEPFEPDDIILAETEDFAAHPTKSFKAGSYRRLVDAISANDPTSISDLLPPNSDPVGNELDVAVGHLLADDQRLLKLRHETKNGPREATDLADRLFGELPEADRAGALFQFTEALNRAKDPLTDAPFLSIRYHQFLRALEGAFVSASPTRQVLLAPKGGNVDGGPAFEIALCRECGQHYIVGRQMDGKLAEAVRDPSRDDFGASFFRPLESAAEGDEQSLLFHLCMACGNLWRQGHTPHCTHDAAVMVEEQPSDKEKSDQISECRACGYRGEDPVREVIHGGDGPHAMIATTLFERLDSNPRKILAFADSRQEAAYFAWYLDDTYQTILKRNVLYRALVGSAKGNEAFSIADMIDIYRKWSERLGLTGEAASAREKRRRAGHHVMGEFLTAETRLSLAGVRLVNWHIHWPASLEVDPILTSPPCNLNREDALAMTFILLDSLRRDRAVQLPDVEEVELDWPDLGLHGTQQVVRLGPPHGQADVVSWNGPRTWRSQFLAKFLKTRGLPQEHAIETADRILRSIWGWLTKFSDRQARGEQLLIPVRDSRRLNPIWYRMSLVEEEADLWRCNTCNRLSEVNLEGFCLRRNCTGSLLRVSPSDIADNHYRMLYKLDLPGNLVVEEHTAQLTTERGQEIQREFQEGRVNVLSCSTTFELGVDLGDLNTVFLRNVPPEAFNYAQRVGRAGRRAGAPGFAITYCRRAPHDLYYFQDPLQLIAGKTKPPMVSLANPSVAKRHVAAVIFASFFRHDPLRFKNVEALIGDWQKPTLTAALLDFLRENRVRLQNDLEMIFPMSSREFGHFLKEFPLEDICHPTGRLAAAELEVASDYRRVSELEERASATADYDQAKWAKARKSTIAGEDVLSFISRKAVIPKYGFPVDVVELDTQPTRSAIDVSLVRDLAVAIGEFAPTATLVARKREWKSYGLKKVPEKELETKHYKVCRQHNTMVAWADGQQEKDLPCGDHANPQKFVIPAFGFISSRQPAGPPARRPTKMFTTRPYFLGSKGTAEDRIEILSGGFKVATIWKAAPGTMAVLCEGKKGKPFRICSTCGAGFLVPPTKGRHETAWGKECSGTLISVALGHEFVTDVVQVEFPNSAESLDSGPIDQTWLSYGMATALLYGIAEEIDAPEVDLNATVGRSDGAGLPVILLYDAVPGGAGLVAKIEDERLLRKSLENAMKRVSGNCGCGEDTSCYGCLRNYRNQFAHPYLSRLLVKKYIESILVNWR